MNSEDKPADLLHDAYVATLPIANGFADDTCGFSDWCLFLSTIDPPSSVAGYPRHASLFMAVPSKPAAGNFAQSNVYPTEPGSFLGQNLLLFLNFRSPFYSHCAFPITLTVTFLSLFLSLRFHMAVPFKD